MKKSNILSGLPKEIINPKINGKIPESMDYYNTLLTDFTRSRYPTIKMITSEMKHVEQGCYKITKANSNKPILCTSGLFTCTGFFGYNKETNEIFLAHFSQTDDIIRNLRNLFYDLEKNNNKFITYFANPTIPAMNIRKILMIDKELSDFFGNPIDIGNISGSEIKEGAPSPGVGIDSRNGNIFIFAQINLFNI